MWYYIRVRQSKHIFLWKRKYGIQQTGTLFRQINWSQSSVFSSSPSFQALMTICRCLEIVGTTWTTSETLPNSFGNVSSPQRFHTVGVQLSWMLYVAQDTRKNLLTFGSNLGVGPRVTTNPESFGSVWMHLLLLYWENATHLTNYFLR